MYLSTLLQVLIITRSFMIKFIGKSLLYNIIYSTKMYNLISFFPLCPFNFLLFSYCSSFCFEYYIERVWMVYSPASFLIFIRYLQVFLHIGYYWLWIYIIYPLLWGMFFSVLFFLGNLSWKYIGFCQSLFHFYRLCFCCIKTHFLL